MVQGGCDGDTFPLFDGYAGNGNWHAGAGGGALPLLDCGYGGAGLCKAMLSGGLPNVPRSMSHFVRPLVRRMRITPIMKTTPKMKTTSKVNMTLEMKKAKLPFIAFISN